MRRRSECTCPCHDDGDALHIIACCYPDDVVDRIENATKREVWWVSDPAITEPVWVVDGIVTMSRTQLPEWLGCSFSAYPAAVAEERGCDVEDILSFKMREERVMD